LTEVSIKLVVVLIYKFDALLLYEGGGGQSVFDSGISQIASCYYIYIYVHIFGIVCVYIYIYIYIYIYMVHFCCTGVSERL
jgi:hypothetical protein